MCSLYEELQCEFICLKNKQLKTGHQSALKTEETPSDLLEQQIRPWIPIKRSNSDKTFERGISEIYLPFCINDQLKCFGQ